MTRLRTDARVMKKKSINSLRQTVTAFNGLQEDGRVSTVLLHLQHAFEMLLKAALSQAGVQLFSKETGRSVGFEGVVKQSQQSKTIKLTDEEAGTLRAVDAMRDDEQHWYAEVDEGLLFLHVRAAITLYDELLFRSFDERLADHLPLRVLPISTEPPRDMQFLIDREYKKIEELLQPGRRARAEARARIRSLLALESHSDPDSAVSNADVNRVEKGIREHSDRAQVFPKLATIGAEISAGEGFELEVRMVRRDGLPVTFDASVESDAAAVRTVDLQKRFHRSTGDLAKALGISEPRSRALRVHMGIDIDAKLSHEFQFGSQKHRRYTDHTLNLMREALGEVDMAEIWASHGAGKRNSRPTCSQPGCADRTSH